MYYPSTPLELWFFLLFLSAGFGAIFTGLGVLVYKAWNKGRAWIFTMPEIPGTLGELERRRLTKGEYRKKLQGQDGVHERVITQDQICTPTKRGPVFVIGQSTGWNLVAPSRLDAPKLFEAQMREKGSVAPVASKDVYARMLVSNPLAYEQAIENNDFGDFVNSKNERDPWQVRIAGLVLVGILFALVAAAGVVWLVTKTQQGG